jgi:hypothetical protein
MASLLALMNCSVSYFTESNSVDCGRSDEEISTDDDEIVLYEDTPKYLCAICECSVPTELYNSERQR